MLYLSFDVASRSLAFSLMYYDHKVLEYLKKFTNEYKDNENKEGYLEHIGNTLKYNIQYYHGNVVDLNNGKKMKDMVLVERTMNLKNTLMELKNALIQKKIELDLDDSKVKVLIEYQMSANYHANAVFNQIFYEFSEFNPVVIHPCYKNKVHFSAELIYSNFSEKYNKNYSANKAHCKENFLYFLKAFNLENIIHNIKKKNLDDIADSFMQIFAYINFYL